MYRFKTIRNAFRLLSLAVGMATLAACSQEEFNLPSSVGNDESLISVLYEVEGDIPLTRGIAAMSHEKSLENVYILYFDHSDSDKLVTYTQAGASEGTSTVKFDPPTELNNNTQYRLLVVGNCDKYAGRQNSSYSSFIKGLSGDYTEVKAKLMAESEAPVTSATPGLLPLFGRYVKQTTDEELYFTFNRTADGITFSNNDDCIFRFKRAICRIDVHNLVGNTLDIRYARLVNTRTKGAYFLDGLNQGEQPIVSFKVEDGIPASPGYVEMPEESNGQNLQRLEAELYCFPNTVNTCLPNDSRTTAVMLAGYYTDPATGEKDDYITYYRFNISNAGDAQTLQRNCCYRATIKGVNRRGDSSEQEAYNATSPVFKYDVGEEWDTDDDNVVTDADGNFLVVSKSLLTFSGDQCGADVVKLTVNTNEDMTWDIEMGEESASLFQYKKIQEATGESIKAFTCGPKQTNFGEYYYEGSLTIVAKNKNSGNVLRKEVRLVQLTTNGDVKCLVVNDHTSSFAQEVSKYGQTISYKVITGNPTNKWTAQDINSTLSGWGEGGNVTFTSGGTNGNYFTITFPANIKEKRSVDIKFEFVSESNGEESGNASEIKPITVTFTQDVCGQPLTIEGWPSDGELTLDCFDTNTGTKYANCVAQSRRFTVHLQRPDEHYITVTSTFDKYRDLTLGTSNGSVDMGNEVRSIHPGLKYANVADGTISTYGDEPTKSKYSDELTLKDRTPSFYINAFRMGPGDPTIEGKITVQVKNNDGTNVPNGCLELTVRLMVPSDRFMINDVMIKNDVLYATQLNNTNSNNGWIYIMDRNIGCDPRMHTDVNDKRYPNIALWCYMDEGETTKEWKITGVTNDTRWLGENPLRFPYNSYASYSARPNTEDRTYWKKELKDTHAHLGKMYLFSDDYPWLPMTHYTLPSIRKNTCVSKGRHFILADPEVCPTKNGKLVRVACWLPSGIHAGYGYTSDYDSNFNSHLALMPNKSVLVLTDFSNSEYGFTNNGTINGYAHLIRLMYMIGFTSASNGTTINPSSGITLGTDKINEELEYYKNHILKCYETTE